ncbi:hypothetical protein RRG08_043152, partial [Elysia crispata]
MCLDGGAGRTVLSGEKIGFRDREIHLQE